MTTPYTEVSNLIPYTPAGDVSESRPSRSIDLVAKPEVFKAYSGERRRTPRKSVVIVLPSDLPIAASRLADEVPVTSSDVNDIIVASAGEPAYLTTLRKFLREAEFLVAPAGTSAEDLRELAMSRATGDIVKLVTTFSATQTGFLPADSADSVSATA
jgi:hypothetical protein